MRMRRITKQVSFHRDFDLSRLSLGLFSFQEIADLNE